MERMIVIGVTVEDDSQLQSARDAVVNLLEETTYVKVETSMAGGKRIIHNKDRR